MISMNDICTKEKLDEFEKIFAENKGTEFTNKMTEFVNSVLAESVAWSNRLNLSDDEEESKILASKMLGTLKIAEDNIDTLTLFQIFTVLKDYSVIMPILLLYEETLEEFVKE